MPFRRWFFLVLVATLFTATPRAGAQFWPRRAEPKPPPQPAHVPISGYGDGSDPARIFTDRLKQLQERGAELTDADLRRLKDFLKPRDPRDLDQQADMARRLLEHPQFQDFAKKWLPSQNDTERLKEFLTKEEIKALSQAIGEFKKNAAQRPASSTPLDPDPSAKNSSQPAEDPTNTGPRGTARNADSSGFDPAAQDAEHQQARAEARRQLLRFGDYLDDVADRFRDSPTVHRALRDLSKQALTADPGGRESLQEQLARFNRYAHRADEWTDTGKSLFGPLDMPSLPRVRAPRVDFSTPKLPTVNAPAVNVPDVGSADAWYAFLWAGVLAAFGFMLWKLWGQWQAGRAEDPNAARQLGPWPVNPARIATAGELIRAFEYFSLLRFGPAARTWNHLDVAAGLSHDQPEIQPAADHLAAAYECARYAPETDQLTDEAIVTARHHLCFLAGVPVA